jgi:heme exporter protein C
MTQAHPNNGQTARDKDVDAAKPAKRSNGFWTWLNQQASPPRFFQWSRSWIRWSTVLFVLTLVPSLYLALLWAPPDYLQGESARIMYVHVPAAWMSMLIYAIMAVQGAGALIWRIKLCEQLLLAAAPVGAMFTAVTLLTGMLWGRPTWGTYWQWDARLTSELVLLFLYFGVIALAGAYADRRAGARAAAVLCLIGAVNLPIIRYSVEWWNTLHQGSSISLLGKNSIAASMLWPLLGMALATKFYFLAVWLKRARIAMIESERRSTWLRDALSRGES